uniref:Protein yippee-like n=1 Tax=Tetraselmis sp. GSL018 TaxID=582737 RepID=A0A061SHD5_9CHLO
MTTGLHTVSDIYCNGCMQLVGWRYDEAFEQSQKYKEGKFILERDKILECHSPISDCQHTLDDSDDEV